MHLLYTCLEMDTQFTYPVDLSTSPLIGEISICRLILSEKHLFVASLVFEMGELG
jgi:hypothetical protein